MSQRALPAALASLSLLAAWMSLAIFIATVVAPAAFAVLPTRALAGALVGRTLPVLFVLGGTLGVLVVFLNRTMDAGRMVTAGAALLAATCASALLVEHRLRRMLDAIGAPIEALSHTDSRRVTFGRLHGISVLLLGIAVVGACIAFARVARVVHTRGTS